MALKPIYTFGGKRWMPISRAASLLATSTAAVKKMMGNGTLEWGQNPRGTTLLVEEQSVLAARQKGGALTKELARRAAAPLRTAEQRKRSMRLVAASTDRANPRRGPGVFDRTWDPSPQALPISGREQKEDEKT